MTQPTDKSGDSTPNFDWVYDPAAPPPPDFREAPVGSDSATSLLPPADGAPVEFDAPAESGSPTEDASLPEEIPLAPTAPLFRLPGGDAPSELIDEGEPGDVSDEVAEPLPSFDQAALVPAPSSAPLMPALTRHPTSIRSPMLLIVLVSYASAVTIALVYLYARYRNPNPHVLESLPDVPPLREGEVQIVPVDAPMPIGHTLRLGESQRFGNLRVEPLRIVRGPAEFTHFSGTSRQPRTSTQPVLELWVRFTNVATDQAIAPLDPHLVFSRRFNRSGDTEAKNFVCRAADKEQGGPLVFLYDHPESSEWDFIGQQLGHVLQPGESFDTFVPSAEEGLDQLTGELLWRVHFRKGYSPRGYGVTTLIEVAFRDDEIELAERSPEGS